MSIDRNKVLKAAQKHIRKRNWDKALKEYRLLVEDDPEDLRSLLKCGDLLVKLDRVPEALQSYKSVADHYAQQDMYEKAIAVYKQAQRLDPEEVVLHHAIGECYYRLGRLKDAVRSFHQAQRMYKERGDHENQRGMLEHMVHIDPEDVGLRIQLAERYTKDGLKDEALECFSFCAEKLEEEGRHDELLQVLERTLFLTPHHHDLRKKAVRLYLDRQDDKTALTHLQVCFRELNDDLETMELLAQTFERLGRIEKAVLVLQELAPHYEKSGRSSDATNLYRRILRLEPGNQMASEALGLDSQNGPDSGVLAGPVDTDSLNQRQHTPAPAADELAGVEFLDDDVEFLDDDVEFLDDDLVHEAAPAARGPAHSQAHGEQPTFGHVDPAPTGPTLGTDDDEEFLDLTGDIELIEEEPPVDEIMEIDAVEFLDDDDTGADDADAGEAEVRSMLSECQVFLKYGLYDKASVAIGNALEASPNSLYAHEQLLALHEKTGEVQQQYRTLITLAELVEYPLRVYDYLKQALDIAPNPQAVHVRAQALGVDLNGPPPTDSLAEISIEALDLVVEPVNEPATIHVDVDEDDEVLDDADVHFLNDDSIVFLEEDDDVEEVVDPFADAFDGLDDVLDGMASHAGAQSQAPNVAEDTRAEITTFEATDGDFAGLSMDTDSEVVADNELQFDDVDIVEMDFEDAGAIDDADFAALDDVEEPDEDSPGFNNLFADVEADDLFDDLFGDMTGEGEVNLGGDDPMGEMAEIDFFIQQGLTEEASEAIRVFEDGNPYHPGLDKRRAQLTQIRSGLTVDDNPFGARSLSQKFNPSSMEESTGESNIFEAVVNSNLELGTAYRDMGLLDEAIEEFRQAADDPEAAISAHFNIALCEIELGQPAAARNTLHQILTMEGVNANVEQTIRQKLDELEAQAS